MSKPASSYPVATILLLALPALLLLPAAPAAARPDFLVGLRAGTADLSGDLYDLVYDETLSPLGAQVEARWTRAFVRLAWETAEADGFLLIPTVGPPPLLPAPAEPTELSLDLLHATGGWSHDGRRWGWFAGAGLTFADAEESNVIGTASASESGYHAVAGGRLRFGARWEVGAEAMYVAVDDLLMAPPASSLSPDLDGIAAAATLAFRF